MRRHNKTGAGVIVGAWHAMPLREITAWIRDNWREIAEGIALVFISWAIWIIGFAGYIFLGGN